MESIPLFYHLLDQIYLDLCVVTFSLTLISQQKIKKSKHISTVDKMFDIISITLLICPF